MKMLILTLLFIMVYGNLTQINYINETTLEYEYYNLYDIIKEKVKQKKLIDDDDEDIKECIKNINIYRKYLLNKL